jgi:hypothetical protein
VLCPTSWPPARSSRAGRPRWITLTRHAYLLSAYNGLDDRSPHVFHLLIGGQDRSFGPRYQTIDPGLRVTTRLVRIPTLGGGTFVAQRAARRIGTTTIDGRPAVLLLEPPDPQGGVHGGHTVALWSRSRHGYLASVHGTAGRSERALVEMVVALGRSMRPV